MKISASYQQYIISEKFFVFPSLASDFLSNTVMVCYLNSVHRLKQTGYQCDLGAKNPDIHVGYC